MKYVPPQDRVDHSIKPVPGISCDPRPEMGPRLSARVDDSLIEDTVGELCRMQCARSLTLMLDVGALIVERLFAGNAELVRLRGRKDRSLRKLAAHPKLPFSAATLWRAVSIYELVQRHPGLVADAKLGISHLRALARLPRASQEALLRQAVSGQWDADRLLAEARKSRSFDPSRGGRPATPALVKAACKLGKLVRRPSTDPAFAIDRLRAEQREDLRGAITRFRAWCDTIETTLALPHPAAGA
ncbi:MAG: hypothetical protein HY898_36475 [Deltaproteobacteria bacterium]|nr:hypothetical protein [Deltaproteobacteria bacterium]